MHAAHTFVSPEALSHLRQGYLSAMAAGPCRLGPGGPPLRVTSALRRPGRAPARPATAARPEGPAGAASAAGPEASARRPRLSPTAGAATPRECGGETG